MSFPLPSVDLTSATVGTKGTISLQNAGVSAGGISANPSLIDKPATLFMFNDSGCGLSIIFSQTGGGVNLPAGGWVPVPLPPGENKITWTVLYVLPSPPVSLLLLTYYPSGEDIPQSMTLGNSPVGIGGNVTTSSIQTLSNENGATGLLVEDWGPLTGGQAASIWNDHFLWNIVQSGILHQVLKGNTTGNPLQIGQAGDISEVLGQLTIDQALTVVAGIFANPPDVSVAGSVSGNAFLWQPLQGKLKVAVVFENNYQNAGVTQTLTFPTAFTHGIYVIAGGVGTSTTGGCFFSLAGATKQVSIITGLAAAGGSIAIQNNVNQFSFAETMNAIDAVNLVNVAGNSHTCHVFIIGS